MLPRRAATAALVLIAAVLPGGCAGAGGAWSVPEAPLPLEDDPPPPPQPPATGYPEAPRAVPLEVEIAVGERRVTLGAPCRVGVWTSLVDLHGQEFVVRETWGRLGERRPRLLLRVEDEALSGVTVRLRPRDDGAVDFVAEVAGATVRQPELQEEWFGQRVTLARPRRHGYRFAGCAPPGARSALLAAWGDGVRVVLRGTPRVEEPQEVGEPTPALPGVAFRVEGWTGYVAGRAVHVERFVEDWTPVAAHAIVADGVQRKEWRLAPERGAAGFAVPDHGEARSWGVDFALEVRAGA